MRCHRGHEVSALGLDLHLGRGSVLVAGEWLSQLCQPHLQLVLWYSFDAPPVDQVHEAVRRLIDYVDAEVSTVDFRPPFRRDDVETEGDWVGRPPHSSTIHSMISTIVLVAMTSSLFSILSTT